jgi:nucleotide-binding universal stress UspA family protein
VAGSGGAGEGGGRGDRRIVVGVDGSESSRRALEWAVAEARVRDAIVHIVHSWSYPNLAGYANSRQRPSRAPADVVADAVRQAADLDASVPTRAEVRETQPARALIEASEGADLVVVGVGGKGGWGGMLTGSVSDACARHASCPVVVVR